MAYSYANSKEKVLSGVNQKFELGKFYAIVGDVYKRQGQYVHAPHTGDVVKVSSGVGKFTCGLRYQ